jgi:membrane-associated phospholipid phosphatase
MRKWTTGCLPLLFLLVGQPNDAFASDDIDWRWRRFQAWEYAATAAALAGGFALRFAAPSQDADWRGGILFDDWIREQVAVDNVHTRRTVVDLTDVLYLGSLGYRVMDSAVLPSVAWGNTDTALQMSMIDLEAFGFVAIVLWGEQALFGRERPYVDRCPGFTEESCDPKSDERNRSFFAGHPAIGMTAAGLTCTHHAHLPLYGGGSPDTIACGVMLGAATMNGAGRVLTEVHYVSDVLIGFGVGMFAGFALPELLHYDHDVPKAQVATQTALPIRVVALPVIGDDQAGAALAGVF